MSDKYKYIDTLITSSMKVGDKDMLSIYRLAKSELIKAVTLNNNVCHLYKCFQD